jgi:RNA polymerase sigma factor (sigma-70 family)
MDGQALNLVDDLISGFLQLSDELGINLYSAAISAVSDEPDPERLPNLLRNASVLLPGLTSPELLSLLEALVSRAPAGGAPTQDWLAWAEEVRQAMRDSAEAKGVDIRLIEERWAGPAVDFSSARGNPLQCLAEIAVLGVANAFEANLRGHGAFGLLLAAQLTAMLEIAPQIGLSEGGLRTKGKFDELVGPMLTGYVRANTNLWGVKGTRLRTALQTRHGSAGAEAALDEELPGAVELSRTEIDQAVGPNRDSPTDIRRILAQLRSDAARRVVQAQAVDLNRKSRPRTVSPDELHDPNGAEDPESDVETQALTFLEFREVLARVSTLTRMERQVFSLVFVRGFTPAEAAETLGISQNASRQHVYGVRRKLRPPKESAPG